VGEIPYCNQLVQIILEGRIAARSSAEIACDDLTKYSSTPALRQVSPRGAGTRIITQFLNEFFIGDIGQSGIEKHRVWTMTPGKN
jgi:hypothetical protein